MDELERLNHTRWECKYQIVFTPKCRRKSLYVQLRQYLGEVFRRLMEQRETRIEEGHLMSGHVHKMTLIPPKWAKALCRGNSSVGEHATVYLSIAALLSPRAPVKKPRL